MCPAATSTVGTQGQLRSAIRDARAGDVIMIDQGTYAGPLEATARGTEGEPIYLCARGRVILRGADPTTPVINFRQARSWRVIGLELDGGLNGVAAASSNRLVLQSLTVTGTAAEGVRWSDNSSDNVLRDSSISRTGGADPAGGTGIAIGSPLSVWCPSPSNCVPDESNRNVIMTSSFAETPGLGAHAYEGTYNGVLYRNRFDGRSTTAANAWVDIGGSSWQVLSNRGRWSPRDGFRTSEATNGVGGNRTFSGNHGRDLGRREAGGYLIALRPDRADRVACSNQVTDRSVPVTNGRCRKL